MFRLFTFAAISGALFIAAGPASATHSWSGYHWSRPSNPFTVTLGNNLTSNWTPYLTTAGSDWSITSGACNNPQNPIRCSVTSGGSGGRKCRPTAGRVEVCNSTYGNNGWLGEAQIWVSGLHITQGTVRLNDTYFNTSTYNTTAWRNLVSCQEVGHTLGLDHQDTNFNNANLGTCMDYTNNPSTNQHPNKGDYDELLCIYDPASAGQTLTTATHSCRGTGHLDSTTTVGQTTTLPNAMTDLDFDNSGNWGRLVSESRDHG